LMKMSLIQDMHFGVSLIIHQEYCPLEK